MTVQELIELLSRQNPTDRVIIGNPYDRGAPDKFDITDVTDHNGVTTIWMAEMEDEFFADRSS
jgi:hypothetical protein